MQDLVQGCEQDISDSGPTDEIHKNDEGQGATIPVFTVQVLVAEQSLHLHK